MGAPPPLLSKLSTLLHAPEHIHTPCSTILLSPTHAYKLKKPVDLGYLNFTTLEARRIACEEELRLNAALAPGVYQRVLAVLRGREGHITLVPGGTGVPPVFVEGSHKCTGGTPVPPDAPEVIDYLVQMRRLPREGMLDAILQHRALTDHELSALVATLVAFHATADASPHIAAHATPEAVRRELLENLAQSKPFVAEGASDIPDQPAGNAPTCPRSLHEHFVRWMDAEISRREPLLAQRARSGFVREGHGDLHAGNICFDPAAATPNNPTGLLIYDRLEFREDFRCRDVAAEIACLAMTLAARGHRTLADRVTQRYAEASGDHDLHHLQPLYRTHYALVRAKVHAMRAAQPGQSAAAAAEHARSAMAYFALAAGFTLGPTLILTCGLPGSGKSYIGRYLTQATGATMHRADEIRKELAGLSATARGGQALYAPSVSAQVYEELAQRVTRDLAANKATIADATFRTLDSRAALITLARKHHAQVVIVQCSASEAETKRRLAVRAAAATDASDADWNVYLKLRSEFVAPSPSESPIIEASEDTTPEVVTLRAVAALVSDTPA